VAVKLVHLIGVTWMTLSGFASDIRSEWVQKRTDIEVVLHELRDLIVKGKTIEARNVRCNIG